MPVRNDANRRRTDGPISRLADAVAIPSEAIVTPFDSDRMQWDLDKRRLDARHHPQVRTSIASGSGRTDRENFAKIDPFSTSSDSPPPRS